MFRRNHRNGARRQSVRTLAAVIAAMCIVPAPGCGVSNRIKARLDLKKGNERYLAGDYHGAITHYDQAVARVPTLAPAYLNRAYSQEKLFRASETLDERQALADSAAVAFEKYRTLVEAGHSAPDTHVERVEEHLLTLYLDSQQPDKAVQVLEQRLQSHPQDMSSLQMLANLSMDLGDYDNSMRWHRRRIELAPDNAEGYVALAVAAWRFSNRNLVPDDQRMTLLDEGVRAADHALQLRPDYYEALIYANLLYREKAKYATSDTQKAEYEKRYTEYQERARQVQGAQKADTTKGSG